MQQEARARAGRVELADAGLVQDGAAVDDVRDAVWRGLDVVDKRQNRFKQGRIVSLVGRTQPWRRCAVMRAGSAHARSEADVLADADDAVDLLLSSKSKAKP